jgi:hypothetical protein
MPKPATIEMSPFSMFAADHTRIVNPTALTIKRPKRPVTATEPQKFQPRGIHDAWYRLAIPRNTTAKVDFETQGDIKISPEVLYTEAFVKLATAICEAPAKNRKLISTLAYSDSDSYG